MKTRTARFTWLLRCAAMTIVLLQAACDESTSTATSSETPATSADSSGRPDATFQTPEALVSHLRALPATGDGKLALYALIEARSTTEEMTMKFLRNVDAAMLRYARAVNETFGQGVEIESTDLGMAVWLEELKTTGTPRIEKRYAYIDYQSETGEPKTLVLVRAGGSWHVAAATLRGGVPPDDQWAARHQGRWGATIQHYRDMAAEVRGGAFATAAEARAELERRLKLPAASRPDVELTD